MFQVTVSKSLLEDNIKKCVVESKIIGTYSDKSQAFSVYVENLLKMFVDSSFIIRSVEFFEKTSLIECKYKTLTTVMDRYNLIHKKFHYLEEFFNEEESSFQIYIYDDESTIICKSDNSEDKWNIKITEIELIEPVDGVDYSVV